MGKESSSLPPVRASDAERDRAVGALRDGSAEGQLSSDSFIRRVDRALRAQDQSELAALVSDLRPQGRVVRRVIDAVSALSSFTARLEAAWRAPRLPPLMLPDSGRTLLVIGRHPACDLVLSDPTVSRHHAELRWVGEEWLLADLHSTNGTRLNGWRHVDPTLIRPGDRVTFGQATFRVAVR